MPSSDTEYEMQERPDDVEGIKRALTYISKPEQIHVLRDEQKYPYIAKPVWSKDRRTGKLFFMGNGHGDIVRFVEVFKSVQRVTLPLSLVSFDAHIDDRAHTNNADLFSSWLEYFRGKKYTSYFESWDIFPSETEMLTSRTGRSTHPSEYLENVPSQIDVVSVDLDVFNTHPPDTDQGDLIATAIVQSIQNAKSVMVFPSPVFSKHGQEEMISREIFRHTIQNATTPL